VLSRLHREQGECSSLALAVKRKECVIPCRQTGVVQDSEYCVTTCVVLKVCVTVSNGGVAVSLPRIIKGNVAILLDPSSIFSNGGRVASMFSNEGSPKEAEA